MSGVRSLKVCGETRGVPIVFFGGTMARRQREDLVPAEQGEQMRTRGYCVIRNAFRKPSVACVSSIANQVASAPATEAIFNGGGGGMVSNNEVDIGDGKRCQVFVDKVKWSASCSSCISVVSKAISDAVPFRDIRDTVVLLSKAGCCDQAPHTDVEIYQLHRNVKRLGDDGVFDGFPLGCLAALQDQTYLNVWDGSINFDAQKEYSHSRIELHAGDLFIFRVDLVHSGAAYEEDNVRIHCFLDREGIVRTSNLTSLFDHKNILPIE